jgi:hypothetical protein
MNPLDAVPFTALPPSFETNRISVMVRANHTLALVRCARATRLWSTKHTEQAGSQLKAAALCIQDAASWLRVESRSRLCNAAAEVNTAGEKLQTGAAWTREEIDHAFIVLRGAVDAVGAHIGTAHKAASSGAA